MAMSSDERIRIMKFGGVYPHYVTKVEKKGRTREELDEVLRWLTGYDDEELAASIDSEITMEEFFDGAALNPAAHLITGVICGHRVEEIENPLTQKVRYMDKLVDELARGRAMEKVLRGSVPGAS